VGPTEQLSAGDFGNRVGPAGLVQTSESKNVNGKLDFAGESGFACL
jgi:hypothetical protein